MKHKNDFALVENWLQRSIVEVATSKAAAVATNFDLIVEENSITCVTVMVMDELTAKNIKTYLENQPNHKVTNGKPASDE